MHSTACQGTWRWTRHSAIRRSRRSGSSGVFRQYLSCINCQSISVSNSATSVVW